MTIFVYPAGLIAADGKYSWYERSDQRGQLRDFAFFDALLEAFSADYCIDLDQIFAVGHSLGASFANSLGCARGSVIRGVGTVAGRVWDIKCSGPAAAIIMHNPNDDLVPMSRGLIARDWALAQNGLKPPSNLTQCVNFFPAKIPYIFSVLAACSHLTCTAHSVIESCIQSGFSPASLFITEYQLCRYPNPLK